MRGSDQSLLSLSFLRMQESPEQFTQLECFLPA